MRTLNPALNTNTFRNFVSNAGSSAMTLEGAAVKTLVLVLLCAAGAILTWTSFKRGDLVLGSGLALGGLIGGFILSLVTIFKRQWSPVTAPIYAALEGFVLGAISAVYDMRFPHQGLALNAVLLTFGTLFSLLVAYCLRLIRATENFKLGVFAATGAIALVYFVSIILGLFGVSIPFLHSNGAIGIGVSVVIVVVAALNLVLDFDFIEQGAASGAPKYMEWYAGFGLLVTLVWLYLEILRLLAKIASRRE